MVRFSSLGAFASRSQMATDESAPPERRLKGSCQDVTCSDGHTSLNLLSAFESVDSDCVYSGRMRNRYFRRAIFRIDLVGALAAVVRKLNITCELYRVN